MLTKNFYVMMAAGAMQGEVYSGVAKNGYGNTVDVAYYNNGPKHCNIPFGTASIKTAYSYGLVVGSGTYPASVDDFALESLITSGFTANSVSTLIRKTEDGAEKVYQIALKNSGSEPLTIAEIGSIGVAYTTASGGSQNSLLTDRTVLETPVVIPVGEVRMIEYVIKLKWPT